MLWWMVPGLLLLAGMISLLSVRVEARVEMVGREAALTISLLAPLGRTHRRYGISDWIETALVHVLKRWQRTGEPVSIPIQKRLRRFPFQRLARVVGPPLHYLRRHLSLVRLNLSIDVGSADAAATGVLTGLCWGAAGAAVGLLADRFRAPRPAPRIRVRARFNQTVWVMRAECMVSLRLGNAIFAGVWLLARALRDPQVRSWVRTGGWRKGEAVHERTSDPGSDEDRNGID